MNNFWDPGVWGVMNIMGMLLVSLLAASLLKKAVKKLADALIPTSVLAGGILLVISGTYKFVTGVSLFQTPFMGGEGFAFLEMITYHALALGFISSTFESNEGELSPKRKTEIFNTGITTVGTYLVQAIIGLAITIMAAKVIEGFFPVAGLLLPFGYGQGTGQAMNYGNIYETQYGFAGGKSFGLTIATLGFICGSIGGVFHLSWLKKKNHLHKQSGSTMKAALDKTTKEADIPLFENMDTLSVQVAFIMGSYLLTYVIMYILGELASGMKSVIYGFNFLIGVLVTTVVKKVIVRLEQKGILKKHYINDFIMVRIRNFFYDLMVVAGIAAIQISTLGGQVVVLVILCVAGAIMTFLYNRFIARKFFPEYAEEQFVAMYGMLTGTASTGLVLLRELDPEFKTPVSDNIVYQNIPAIIFGFPLMIIASNAPKAPMQTLIIAIVYFSVLNIILFRSKLFGKKEKTK